MTNQQPVTRPTAAELDILNVLWAKGPSTVRVVVEALNRQKRTGYTTVLTFMQIMAGKGLVVRDETQQAHVYRAAVSEQDTRNRFVDDLAGRLFAGRPARLALHALTAERVSDEELEEIRALLDARRGT
jgi:BlaI family penicillinase repressor